MSPIVNFFKDLTKSEIISIKQVKKLAISCLLLGMVFPLLFLGDMLEDGAFKVLHLHVESPKVVSNIDSNRDTTYGIYSTESEGVLQYRPRSIIEALFLYSPNGLTILDILFFFYVGVVLFKVLNNIDEQSPFQRQIQKAFAKVAKGCIYMFPLRIVYGFFQKSLFSYQTKNMYHIAHPFNFTDYLLYIFAGGIIFSLLYFLNKGEMLQEEKDLTI